MGTKNNPGEFDCYQNAGEDEEMFVLLGRDRHAAALVRLWAEMREREGEDPKIVAEARECADKLAAEAARRGKPVFTLDTVVNFATTLKQEQAAVIAAPEAATTSVSGYELREGEIVIAHRGLPAKLIKIFTNDDPEQVRGLANIQSARAAGPTTVPFASLRRAMPEEVEIYRLSGGRI